MRCPRVQSLRDAVFDASQGAVSEPYSDAVFEASQGGVFETSRVALFEGPGCSF